MITDNAKMGLKHIEKIIRVMDEIETEYNRLTEKQITDFYGMTDTEKIQLELLERLTNFYYYKKGV